MADANDLKMFLAVEDAAAKQGVNPDVIHRMLRVESGGNPQATSPKGAYGPMQLMPGTARDLGVDPTDPIQNIQGGVKYYAQLRNQFGSDELARAAYNAGPGNVRKYHGVPPFPETQAYLRKTSVDSPQVSTQAASQASPDDLKAFLAADQAPDQQDQPASVSGFLDNVGKSAGDFASGIGHTLMHPIDTLTNLGKLGIGAAEKILPDSVKESLGDYTPQADAVGQFYKQRYGGLSNIGHTLYTDPVGAAADASMLFGGAELLPGKLGKLAGTASELTNPLNVVLKPAEAVGKLGAEGLMANALRPSRKVREEFGGTRNIARTALDEGINVSDRGLDKISGKRAGLASDKAAIEQQAMDAERTVNPADIYRQVQTLYQQKGVGKQLFPDQDISAVEKVLEEWKAAHQSPIIQKQTRTTNTPSAILDESGKPFNIKNTVDEDVVVGHKWNPITDLLKLEEDKQGTYRSLKEAFRKLGDRPGRTQAEAQAALGAKGTLENATAGFTSGGRDLAAVNAQDARLNGVSKAVRDRLDTPGPNMGFDLLLGALGGHASPPMIAIHQIMGRPRVSSQVARLLDWMAKPDTATLGKAGALQPNRLLTQKAALLRALGVQQD